MQKWNVAGLALGLLAAGATQGQFSGDALVEGLRAVSQERAVKWSPDGSWAVIDRPSLLARASQEWIRPNESAAARLDVRAMRTALDGAPMEFTNEAFLRPALVDIPRPDGTFEVFELVEAPVMAPELQAKYPEIRTYRGQSLDNPHSNIRVSVTPRGVRASVASPEGWYYVDRYSLDDESLYTSYRKVDLENRVAGFECRAGEVEGAFEGVAARNAEGGLSETPDFDALLQGGELRTYRIAVAATLQFTNFFGGSVQDGLGGVVDAVNRMTQVYENDIAVRFVLVPNNDQVIYTNSNPDPFSSFPSLSQLDSVLDQRIGSANYDVGHLVDTGAGGFASLGVVCSTSKGRGYTGLTPPTGDPFWIDYFSHEVGHQFAANHTFNGRNGSCSGGNRSGANAFEPGSGSTIMGYAGICGSDNVSSNSGAYFHFESIAEMRNHVTNQSGANCPVITPTGNSNPTVEAGPAFVVPIDTPFILTASGSDPDGDALTYCWEQADLGPARNLGAADNGSSPLFRSFDPTPSPSRSFPAIQTAWSGGGSRVETLPTTNRTMNFRVTVRDNRSGGGATAVDSTAVTSTTSAGPFRVTSQANNPTLNPGDTITVNWDVANTDSFPLLASTVTIAFAANGVDFDTILAESVPNDGSQQVTVPDEFSTNGRIRVMADENIFYAVNTSGITVETPPEPAEWSVAGGAPTSVEPDVATQVVFTFNPGSFEVVNGSGILFTRVNGQFGFDTLSELGNDEYLAVLPAIGCDDTLEYQVQITLTTGELVSFPDDGSFVVATADCGSDCPADVNGDGELTGADFNAWLAAFTDQDPIADQNNDGEFNGADFNAWLGNFNNGCP